MELMSPTDSMFLIAETREHPFHVGGLALYEPPAGAGGEFVRELHEEMVSHTDFQPVFRKRPSTILGAIANVGWSYDDEVDLDYHLRRSALPSPGRVRDLLELTSRLHGSLLDRHRPLWEAHLIEGLADGRFAVYTKMHHSLIDGVSALKLLMRTLSEDPDDTALRVPWTLPRRKRPRQSSSLARTVADTVGSVAGLAPSTVKLARAALLEQQLTLPFSAPRRCSTSRSAAPDGWRRSPGRWNGSSGSRGPPGSRSTTWCSRSVAGRCAGTCWIRMRCRNDRSSRWSR